MLRFVSVLARVSVVFVALSLLTLQGWVHGQVDAFRERGASLRSVRADGAIGEATAQKIAATVIVGRVIGPDGAPAAGAVVVTSAGGQAVTDAQGAFNLEVEVPAGAESVRVTAVLGSGTASLVGSAQVGALAHGGTTNAGTLNLEQAGTCQPSWLPTFGSQPGILGGVRALAVFDDGGGPALYAAGVSAVAKWNGSSWSALGSGLGSVYALAVFNDGTGPALYAGGGFSTAFGGAADHIAKWNGTSWAALGSGVNDDVRALVVFDKGSGPDLYAGGKFTTAGGAPASCVAKWNGATWSKVGNGVSAGGFGFPPSVYALTVFDDGSGPVLCAGGNFLVAGQVQVNFIAKWNGSSWSPLGSGMSGGFQTKVEALAAFDDGSGPALYAGGDFTTAGGAAANRVAKWNGSSWSALGSGLSGFLDTYVFALAAVNDGSGPALYVGGEFTSAGGVAANFIAKWNGSSWSALGNGTNHIVRALADFDDGGVQAVYAGGDFTTAGGMTVNSIAKWDGTSWSGMGSGLNNGVVALTVFDDGSGSALYAGGYFTYAGDVLLNHIAKWNGSSWSALGGGMNSQVYVLTVFDDGSGSALYAGGAFTTAGGVAANSIAKWNGSSWSALGSGTNLGVGALTVFDGGSGPALYAGGSFTTAGGVAANSIAKWNGSSWSALGSGINGYGPADLTVFDDGSGPALYAGGAFTTAGGVAANSIAKWNGSSWSALGSGLQYGFYTGAVALAVFDDGSGPALYAGGDFTTAGGVAAYYVAKWNGSSWSALASGMNDAVYGMTVFDDGSGAALYAGGWFSYAGDVPAVHVAKWNGSSWSALGSGMYSSVNTLTVFDDGSGPALYAGGFFTTAIDSGDSYLAKWGGCSPPRSPWTDLGYGLAGVSGIPQLNGSGDLLAGTPGNLHLIDAAPSAPATLFISGSNMPTPFKGGTLLTVPVLLTLALLTDSQGDILLQWGAFPPGLSGVSLYFQFGIQDASAIKGAALSNALGADVP